MNFMRHFVILVLAFAIPAGVHGQVPPPSEVPNPESEPAVEPPSQTAAGGPSSIEAQGQGLFLEVLEDFEDAEDWTADSTSPLGETKVLKLVQRGEIRSVVDGSVRPPVGEAYSILQDAENPNHVLGVKGYFRNRGFDRIEIKPPHEYKISGQARQFSVWVLGRNYRHMLYIKVRGPNGRIHKLPMGRLNFYGWNKLTAIVPGWLKQTKRSASLGRSLHFVSLFVVSDAHESSGQFYFYVDGLKALVDRSGRSYPGSEIRDNW